MGTEKTRPLSFTPRRLMMVMKPMMPTASGTRHGAMVGKAETIWATPEEMDTATVRM